MGRCSSRGFLLVRRVTWLRCSTLLVPLILAPPARAGDAQELAQAVRTYYDEGAEPASKKLLAIVDRLPERDDAAWWLARCQLDLGRADAALTSLGGRDGENIPGWRFPALEAHASLLMGEVERAGSLAPAAIAAAPDGASGDVLLEQARWIAAGLAARSGDHPAALTQLVRLRGVEPAPVAIRAALPELDIMLAAPLAAGAELPAPILMQAAGRWWALPAGGGLAMATTPPAAAVLECVGPDLCTALGEPLLSSPGIRSTPSSSGPWVLYAAGREPLDATPDTPGLFRWRAGLDPERITAAPAGAQDLHPVAGPGDTLFFLRVSPEGTRLMRWRPDGSTQALAPDLGAIASLTVAGDRVIVVAVSDGASALRSVAVDAGFDQPSTGVLDAPIEPWSVRLP